MNAGPHPVLLVGENHAEGLHDLAERKILQEAAARGYDTLMLEKPNNLQEPLQAYLRSARKPEDWRAVIDFYLEALYPVPAASAPRAGWRGRLDRRRQERGAEERRLFLQEEGEALARGSWRYQLRGLAEEAERRGLRTVLCDVPASPDYLAMSRQEKRVLEGVAPRNAFMAERIAAEARAGHGVLMIGGLHHLDDALTPGSSLKLELERRGVPSLTFALGRPAFGKWEESRRERKLLDELYRRVDYVETALGRTVAQALQERGIGFRRAGEAGGAAPGGGPAREK
ncbi:MAG: hypothetical protein PW734_01945 [Verrucomicrobium sp.]|nr:hypothetical protein [Verrucomicrobium sp.]